MDGSPSLRKRWNAKRAVGLHTRGPSFVVLSCWDFMLSEQYVAKTNRSFCTRVLQKNHWKIYPRSVQSHFHLPCFSTNPWPWSSLAPPPLCFYLLLCLHNTPSDFLYAFVLTRAIHARACTFKPYPFGSLHTLHPQCSHLEFSHSLISRVLFYHSNTSMSELKHTFHIHHTSPSLFLFSKASVLGLFLWPAPRLLCSFRNFGADSNILNQVQAATAARAPSLLVFHPTCWPQGVFVCRKGADNQATDNLSQEDFAACHIPFPLSLNSSLSIIFPPFSLFCHYWID